MCPDVWVRMHTCPLVQTDGEVPPQRSATGKARLEGEQDRSAGLVLAETLREQRGIVGNVLGHKEPALRDGVVEHLIVGTTGQTDIANGESIVTACHEFLRGLLREHLVEQPPHDSNRSRRLISSRS